MRPDSMRHIRLMLTFMQIYSETLQERYPDSKQEVAVLRGGFTDFQAVYRVRLDVVSRPTSN